MFFPAHRPQIFTLWQKRPYNLEETLHEICDAQEMLHYGLLLGRKNTHAQLYTYTYRNKLTKKQKFAQGGIICRNHLISGKIKQINKVCINIHIQEQHCDLEKQRHADFGKYLFKSKRCQCQSCSCTPVGVSR